MTYEVEGLSDYMEIISAGIEPQSELWFRGHSDVAWTLIPSALRYSTANERRIAVDLIRDFRRIAEIKMDRPPQSTERLKWWQLAQHYGIPTRLLDWTESALFALYFAVKEEATKDGIVYVLNPLQISLLRNSPGSSSLDAHLNEGLLDDYFGARIVEAKSGLPTVAIKPVWNSERLMIQRGVFTLHGDSKFALDNSQCPSLVGIPILSEHKGRLLEELDRIGVDEMTLFPELEHVCSCLKKKRGLR